VAVGALAAHVPGVLGGAGLALFGGSGGRGRLGRSGVVRAPKRCPSPPVQHSARAHTYTNPGHTTMHEHTHTHTHKHTHKHARPRMHAHNTTQHNKSTPTPTSMYFLALSQAPPHTNTIRCCTHKHVTRQNAPTYIHQQTQTHLDVLLGVVPGAARVGHRHRHLHAADQRTRQHAGQGARAEQAGVAGGGARGLARRKVVAIGRTQTPAVGAWRAAASTTARAH
jgi:hypothetical protein